ncbi:MAG: peptidase [Solobacterium sp.]|jgi:leucyl aminopeptidase (aminopeptidase T)|nr:peptidase [Solobacterium sp.]
MEQWKIQRGAEIIIDHWVNLQKDENLCIVTSNLHRDEAKVLEEAAEKRSKNVSVMIVRNEGIHVGDYFDDNPNIFDCYDVIIGATDYSIVTTKACDKALKSGRKFLSLPLSTGSGESMLGFDFLAMDTDLSRIKAQILISYIQKSSLIRVSTALGTDLSFHMRGRKPGFFNGTFRDNHSYSSSSIEVYIPIVETGTEGTLVCDGSFGYIGKTQQPVKMVFHKGKITEIEQNAEGKRLQQYFESYHDPRMYYGGEFGIGLNSMSHCDGNCYIEDESTYGTFHIGVGRNIGLGGRHEASGHFDLVTQKPTIWFDNRMIMKDGVITIPEFEL